MYTRLLLLCLCCLSCIQCGPSRDQHKADDTNPEVTLVNGEHRAQLLVNKFKQANNVIFSLYMVYNPPKKAHMSFSLTAWAPADGRIRIRLTKLGVDFLEGLIDKDGNFTGVLVRDNKIVKGTLDQLMPKIEEKTGKKFTTDDPQTSRGAPLFAALDLLRNEIKHGPVNIADSYQLNKQSIPQVLHIPLKENFTTQLALGVKKTQPVLKKTIFNAQQREIMSLRYSKYADMDGLYRAKKMQLFIPNDESVYLFRLKKLDVIKNISQESMYLEVPDYPQIKIEDFAKKVTE
ncbi:MAG: hypothetical protein HRU15_11145 [Planctomycetes bacterium]|nr:hypothetical protein [Planctomycetota bacterium]